MEVIICRDMHQCCMFGAYATGLSNFKFTNKARTDKDLITWIKSEMPTRTIFGRPTNLPLFEIITIPAEATDFDVITIDDEITIEYLIYCMDGKIIHAN